MPITETDKSIHLYFFIVHDSVTDLRGQNRLGHLYLNITHPRIERSASRGLQVDPHKIDRHHHTVLTSFDGSHQSDVEMRKQIAGADMHAGVAAERTYRPADSRKPEIGRYSEVPAVIRGRAACASRTAGGLSLGLRLIRF